MCTVREIIDYKFRFKKFYDFQEAKVKRKIGYVLDIVRYETNVPGKFLKHLENTDSIYELRIITTFKNIRILCFFDNGNLVVLTNCYVKKSQKTPIREIRLAERLKKEYTNDKYRGHQNEKHSEL